MARKQKRGQIPPPPRDFNFFKRLWEQVRLSWSLMLDSRVPISAKIIPIVAVAYTLSPIDLVPDIFPLLGQLDDLGLLMTALSFFNNMAPADVAAEYLTRMREGNPYKVTKDDDGSLVIDVKPKRSTTSEETTTSPNGTHKQTSTSNKR